MTSSGDSVGAAVGDSVGAAVGESVGTEVGDSVGAAVGDSVGAAVRLTADDLIVHTRHVIITPPQTKVK